MRAILFTLTALCLLAGCSKDDNDQPIKIAMNPWPGYEFLYLAEQKGYFEKAGLNIKLLQVPSLADVQRAYLSGNADGMASTIIEAVQVQVLSKKPLNTVLLPDYSNGGDIILARTDIHDVTALKGKKIGCEVTSLGIFVLSIALEKKGLSLDDVTLVNVEQSMGHTALNENKIDAFVTYPPMSIEIMKNERYHAIFSSSETPKEIIDTVTISKAILEKRPLLISKLLNAWQMALDEFAQSPSTAISIMAKREGILESEFEAVLDDISILNAEEQKQLLQDERYISKAARDVCRALVSAKSLETDCDQLPSLTDISMASL